MSITVDGPVRGTSGDSTLRCAGTLDATTYRTLRDIVIDAALKQPPVVIVDVNALRVPAVSAWSVFTSARWHVSVWPDVPVVLASADDDVRKMLCRNGITHHVPVYRAVPEARAACESGTQRRRSRRCARLPFVVSSAALARELVGTWLTAWCRPVMIPLATTVASELVENALLHTESAPSLILECDGDKITVAVEDGSRVPAQRTEHAGRGASPVSGLAVVAALSRAWGSTPMASGKTVWAVMGPENEL